MTEYVLNGRRLNVENTRNYHEGITYIATDMTTGKPVFELSNDANEKLHGKCLTFHENGKIKCTAKFNHGKKIEFHSFDENGKEIFRSEKTHNMNGQIKMSVAPS